ncbi:AMP-binding protein [Actinosynnema sp. CS-041913]|uniref:AMP-binding protein n=1 Tax=Actinosynnema sp. CS-041913 TaxID=3239917 RepID=UPI003D92874D
MIHEVFRGRVLEQPDAVALVHREGTTSYAELDRMSDEIALELAASGIGKGNVVPVVLPLSPVLVATLLAVLKCGAAYAVLDRSWPAERLRRIDSLLPGQVAVADAAVDAFPRRPGTAHQPPPITDETAAMVFFTAGSTGGPKAVVSPHQATMRLFQDCVFATFDHTTVMPQVSAVPWDAFALELWGVLLTGGTSVLVEDRPLTPAAVRSLVSGHGVNTLFLTTSLFHLVVEEDVEAFAGLDTLVVGGEKLSARHAGRLLAACPEVRLVNGYGPVESTVFALTHDVRPVDVVGEVPLGRPVTGTSVHVLADGRECGPGEVGELVVAGDGLALGYLGDPGLTARKFVTASIDGYPIRVYRTGDHGSVDADGVFHFHGRRDRQVKVRGHRVEPAGIEHVAAGVPGVRRCAVVPVADGEGTRLALFFSGDGVSAAGLADRLRASLPAYSVPDHVVAVSTFPLSPNGKVDSRKLLEALPEAVAPGVAGDSVEDVVAAEFAALLGSADRDRSFFALGGTSLGAVRLCTRLGARFGRAIPVSRLMSAPTATEFAAWLTSAGISSGLPHGPVLTPMQHSFVVRHALAGGLDIENHCPLMWTIAGPVRPAALEAAVQDVHRRHGYLHARYTDGDEPQAVEGERPAEFVRLVAEREDARYLLDVHLSQPLDLAAGVPWRAVLVQTPDAWEFGLAVHRAAFDGWSRHRLAEDLSVAYRARVRGREPRFARPAPTPADTARILASLADAADLAAQQEFWTAELAGLPGLVFPAAKPGAYVLESPVDVAAVDAAARRSGAGRLAVLVDAVARAVSEHTGQADFGIGVPVTQRATEALELPVGCLVDTVCVRVGNRPAAEAVARALANADLPFAEVSRRATGRQALYQVIAAVQDSPEPDLDLPGCRVEWHDEPTAPLAELQVELIAPAGAPAKLRVSRNPDRVDVTTMSTVLASVLGALAT